MRKQFNARLPQSTINQIVELIDLMEAESQSHVIIMAVDRMYVKETKMNKKQAYIEAVENADRWMGGAVVVKEGRGYEAIPQAYLSDASYTGSRAVVLDLSNGLENSTGYSLNDGTARDIAKMLL